LRGKNHIAMNCCTAVCLAELGAVLRDVYTGPGHAAVSSCVDSVASYFHNNGALNPYLFAGLCVSFFVLGSLLPDIDSPYSTIGRVVHVPVEHRTWTHTIWFVIAFGIGSIWFRPLIWLAFAFFFHLFWDNFSRSGICFIYPIVKKRKHHFLKLYTTSSTSELIVVIVVLLFTVCLTVLTVYLKEIVPAMKLLLGNLVSWMK